MFLNIQTEIEDIFVFENALESIKNNRITFIQNEQIQQLLL